MTLVSQIITDGYRECNLIGKGVEPDDTEAADGLRRLQAIVLGVFGWDVGEPLADWPVGLDGITAENLPPFGDRWTPELWQRPTENVRLLIDTSVAQTIYFPADPDDGARMAVIDVSGQLATYPITLDGNGRLIGAARTAVLNTDGFAGSWFYRADLGRWAAMAPMLATDDFVFPPEFDDTFTTLLAYRLNPRYGRAMDAGSGATAADGLTHLRARYKQRRNVSAPLGVLNLSVQTYNTWNGRGRVRTYDRNGRWM